MVPPDVRAQVIARDGRVCQICGGRTRGVAQDSLTMDHIVPKSRGGRAVVSNLRVAHKRCNEERGDAPATDPFPVALARQKQSET